MIATWIGFLSYILITLGIGWWAQKKKDQGTDFWTAGRSLGGVSVGLSISAGFISVSWSCVYAVQLFYWYGIGAVWLITVPWLLALAGIYYLSRRYHQLPAFSQPEMVAARFGKSSKRMVALALGFVFLIWGGAEIYVAGTLLSPALGISRQWVILIVSAVVGVYSTMGGFRAVVLTDKLQYTIVALYILAMAGLAASGLSQVGMKVLELPLTGAKSTATWSNPWAPGLVLVGAYPGRVFARLDFRNRSLAAGPGSQEPEGCPPGYFAGRGQRFSLCRPAAHVHRDSGVVHFPHAGKPFPRGHREPG
jgi:solute:Na+ symporter, SSS family